MKQEYSISIYLDTRRAKSNGKYPVKLRVFTGKPRIQKLYPTKFEFTKEEFNSTWNTTRPRTQFKQNKQKLQALELKANEVAENLNPFTFEQFDKLLFRNSNDGVTINYHYNNTIERLTKLNRLGTADSYRYSQKAIQDFVINKKRKSYEKLSFYDINKKWLEEFEYYLTEEKRKSPTTVGIYLRALKALFNLAIEQKEIDIEYYPFGSKKYQIPSKRKVNKALSQEQLKTLFESVPQTPEQEKAKDFWFFSYACYGMNIKDIALLKFNDLLDDKIEFVRAKTKLTSKNHSKPIVVHLNNFSKGIINKYQNKHKNPENYVFEIITKGLSPHQQERRIKNFTRFINQHIKKLCKLNNLPEDLSTYWARHSFATISVRKGASMEFIQESLGHKDLTTTQNYFAGFDNDTKKQFSENLMDF